MAYGQSQSLIEGPIRSEDASNYDVEMIRTTISPGPSVGSVPGMSFVHISSDSPAPENVTLRAQGFLVSRLSVNGVEPEWHQLDGALLISLPEQTPTNGPRYEWLVKIEYLIGSGLTVRTNKASRIAVWNGSEAGSDSWYPTPFDQLDSYLTQLRVFVPKFWDVWVGSGGSQFHPEGVVDGFSTRPVFAGAVSFFAFDARAAHPGEFIAPVITTHETGFESYLATFESNRKVVESYISSIGFLPPDSTFKIAVMEGISGPLSIGNGLLLTAESSVSGNPWQDLFESLNSVVRGIVSSRFESVPPTDSWIAAAIPDWLTLQAMTEMAGADASGLMYEQMRDAYLNETLSYKRPLVWDRWEYPEDMMDWHAHGKGVWVLRMLAERIGEEALGEAIVRFMEAASTEIVDTETFREILEAISRERLGQFFDVWVYSAGHPRLSLEYTFDAANELLDVQIGQQQVGDLVPDAFEFDMSIQYSSLEGTNTSMLRLDSREQSSRIKMTLNPRYVFPDAFATVLLDYASPLKLDVLVSQLRDAIGPVPKIRSLRYLAQTHPDPTVLLGLRLFLQQETEPAVLAAACDMLAVMAPSNSALTLLTQFASHQDGRVRQAAIKALANFPTAESAFEIALNAANTGTNAYELSEAVATLVKVRPSITWSLIQSALVTPSEGDLVARTALSLIQSGVTTDRNLFGAIRPLLAEEHGMSLRIAAFEAFARIDAGGNTVQKTVSEWLDSSEFSLRSAALKGLLLYPEIEYQQERLESLYKVESSPYLRRTIEQLLAPTAAPDQP